MAQTRTVDARGQNNLPNVIDRDRQSHFALDISRNAGRLRPVSSLIAILIVFYLATLVLVHVVVTRSERGE